MKKYYLLGHLLCFQLVLNGQEINFQQYATGFVRPVDIQSMGDDRLFIVEQDGYIRIIENGGIVRTGYFLDINARVRSTGNEQGLLGLAFHPNYTTNGYFFVNYIDNSGNTQISRFSVNPADANDALENSELMILNIPQPYSNHNGGQLAFGQDGYLYIGMGDGGSAGDPGNRAQNPQNLLGKMLRIDIDNTTGTTNYVIPSDNPFVGSTSTKAEIWAIGLRNPWRFAFDRLTYDMWIADVGQGTYEEVNYEPNSSTGGVNYGWRCYEGSATYNTSGCSSVYQKPNFVYDHTTGGLSITGGYVYRGSLYPDLYGHYIFADYVSGNFWSLKKEVNPDTIISKAYGLRKKDVVSFGLDNKGELYASELTSGKIFRVGGFCMANPATAPTILQNNNELIVQVPNNTSITWFLNGTTIPNANNDTLQTTTAGVYTVQIRNSNGCLANSQGFNFSPIGLNTLSAVEWLKISPNPNNGNFQVSFLSNARTTTSIEFYNILGQNKINTIYIHTLQNQVENIPIRTEYLAKGNYYLKISNTNGTVVEKIIIH